MCPPASLRGVSALCLQTDKEQQDLVFWSTLRAQRLWLDSRWLMQAQRKGPLRNREMLKDRSAQKDSRLTIGWLNAKLRASDKECGFMHQWRRSSEGQTYMYSNRYTHRPPEPQPSGTSFTQRRGVDSLTPAHGVVMVCQGRQTYGDLNAGPCDWQSSLKKSKKAVLWDSFWKSMVEKSILHDDSKKTKLQQIPFLKNDCARPSPKYGCEYPCASILWVLPSVYVFGILQVWSSKAENFMSTAIQ